MRIVEILFYDSNMVKLVVEMPDPDRCTTDCAPHVPRGLFQLIPQLSSHKCHNGNGYSFEKEAEKTEVPHLLEHLIIQLQAQAQHHDVLKGETQWNWRVDPRGTFHVHVEYHNEHLVLAAIRLAERIMHTLDRNDIESIDMEHEMWKLSEIARIGQAIRADDRPHLSCTRPFAQLAPMGVKASRTRSRPRRKKVVEVVEAVVD